MMGEPEIEYSVNGVSVKKYRIKNQSKYSFYYVNTKNIDTNIGDIKIEIHRIDLHSNNYCLPSRRNISNKFINS